MFTPEQLAAWTGGRWTHPPRAPLLAIRHDSSETGPGVLFLAVRGERTDGHRFVADALARGAEGAIVEPAAATAGLPAGAPLLVVGDTRRALLDLASGHRARMTGRIVGVTGSVGKTTVKDLAAAVLAAAGPVARTRGNFNNDLGLPLSLLAADPSVAHGVFEIGMNHPGELAPLCRLLRPHWGVMALVGPVHLEFFAGEAAIAEEKATLLRALPADGLAVLAADEPWFDLLRAAAPCRVVTVALDTPADYRGRADPADPRRLLVTGPDGAGIDCRLPVRGQPMLRNALRAVAAGREAGVSAESIAGAVAAFEPPPMRGGERAIAGVTWVNDAYNSSPVSLQAALETFAVHPARRRWVVVGGMRELGRSGADLQNEAGRQAAAGPWTGIVVVGALAAPVADGAVGAGWPAERLWRCDGPPAAAALLAERLRPGDAVLLKGSRGERMEEVLAEWARLAGAPAEAPAH
ncbi:MAG: UDP-N-acetylmuramoyl-tripeptide--D-alanyl-D-alanine ligase [Lentisphaerae bacterium]|nr:UDP-N-acetylmuramoyl-tripeptide--D-alanyl-D-alanine ligase [Lentisphaerota bacterium]